MGLRLGVQPPRPKGRARPLSGRRRRAMFKLACNVPVGDRGPEATELPVPAARCISSNSPFLREKRPTVPNVAHFVVLGISAGPFFWFLADRFKYLAAPFRPDFFGN
jgi:hypothetical protein